MADYSDKIKAAYDKIAAKGGKVYFPRPADNTPSDPDLPWEGNNELPEDFEHVAVLLPLNQEAKKGADSNHRIMIPAYKLPFEITMNQELRDEQGRKYAITAITYLAPDPSQIILYDCECAIWPTQAD